MATRHERASVRAENTSSLDSKTMVGASATTPTVLLLGDIPESPIINATNVMMDTTEVAGEMQSTLPDRMLRV